MLRSSSSSVKVSPSDASMLSAKSVSNPISCSFTRKLAFSYVGFVTISGGWTKRVTFSAEISPSALSTPVRNSIDDRRIEERRRFECVFPAEKRANKEPARCRQRPIGKDMHLDPPVNAQQQ